MGALGSEDEPWRLNCLRPPTAPSMSILSLNGPFFSSGHSGFLASLARALTQLGKEVLVLCILFAEGPFAGFLSLPLCPFDTTASPHSGLTRPFFLLGPG